MKRLIYSFYRAAENSGIKWCHWKSNANLALAVDGRTDLDLLFYEKDKSKLEDIFREIGAVKFSAVKEKRYPCIDDYIAVDMDSGTLFHFHVHYQLDIGEKMVKSYRIPRVDEILNSRVKHPEIDFWIIKPEIELLLLIIRQVLRIPPFSIIGDTLPTIGSATEYEFVWLKSRINGSEFKKTCEMWVNTELRDLIIDLIDSGITVDSVIKLNGPLRSFFSCYRQKSNIGVFLSLYIKKHSLKLKEKKMRIGVPAPVKRVFPGKGIMIAFVGVDGSGKSTFANETCLLLRKKLDVKFIYFGHGKSHNSKVINAFRRLSKIAGRINGELGEIVFSTGIAFDKYIKFYQAKKAVSKGMVVVCDRFPQTTVNGWCDGLRLAGYSSSKRALPRLFSVVEKRIYSISEKIYPDLIFKIVVDSKVAYERRKDRKTFEIIEKKSNIFRSIVWPKDSIITELNNNDIELSEIKKRIMVSFWNYLTRII